MITHFLDLYDQIYNFFSAADFSRFILLLKLISYSVSLFFVFLIAVLLKKSNAGEFMKDALYARQAIYGAGQVNEKWLKIQRRLQKGDDTNLKLAIIEADNIFDDILKLMGLPGADFEQRLRQFEPHELKSVNLVWEAHYLRDQIIKEPTMQITKEQAEQAIRNYEAALKELEYL